MNNHPSRCSQNKVYCDNHAINLQNCELFNNIKKEKQLQWFSKTVKKWRERLTSIYSHLVSFSFIKQLSHKAFIIHIFPFKKLNSWCRRKNNSQEGKIFLLNQLVFQIALWSDVYFIHLILISMNILQPIW